MIKPKSTFSSKYSASPIASLTTLALVAAILSTVPSCGSTKKESKRDEFFTSGSREADQRATQRMAKDEQLAGSGEAAGEKGRKKTSAPTNGAAGTNKVEGK